MPTAFFNMSRSWRNTSFSLRRRASSSSWPSITLCPERPQRDLPRTASSSAPTPLSLIPRSREAWVTLSPPIGHQGQPPSTLNSRLELRRVLAMQHLQTRYPCFSRCPPNRGELRIPPRPKTSGTLRFKLYQLYNPRGPPPGAAPPARPAGGGAVSPRSDTADNSKLVFSRTVSRLTPGCRATPPAWPCSTDRIPGWPGR